MSLLDTASLIVTPNGYKEGKLYSVIPSDGSGDLSVTRATTATRVNSQGLVELVPYNLLTYSQDFNNAIWYQENITPTTGQADPLGANNAFRFRETTTNGEHWFFYLFLPIPSSTITQSIYVKSDGRDQITFGSVGNTNNFIFTFSTGAISSVNGFTSTSATNVGNGWYRLTGTFSASSPTNLLFIKGYNGGTSYVGDTNKGFFAFGAQAVEGSVAKDYQKTETRLNIPRLDYSNGTCPSILVEPQRTNLVTYSSSFDNAVWNKSNTTISANNTTSPSGINDADSLVPNTSNAAHFIENSNYLNLSVGQTYTTSFYAKANGYNFIQFTADGGDISGNPRANFNLSNGTLGSVDAGITASIQDVGNGWYRCVATYVAAYNVFNNIICVVNSSTAARAEAFVGNGTSGISIWGAQLEAGSYATSYIPTTSASVTRNADVISKTGISSLIGQTEGSVFLDFVFKTPTSGTSGTTEGQIAITDNSGDNRVIIWNNFTLNTLGLQIRANGTNAINNISLGSFVDGTRYKIAIGYKSGDNCVYVNGTQVISNAATFSFVSPLTNFILGGYYLPYDGHQLANASALWKTRLTNAQLATLTTI